LVALTLVLKRDANVSVVHGCATLQPFHVPQGEVLLLVAESILLIERVLYPGLILLVLPEGVAIEAIQALIICAVDALLLDGSASWSSIASSSILGRGVPSALASKLGWRSSAWVHQLFVWSRGTTWPASAPLGLFHDFKYLRYDFFK